MTPAKPTFEESLGTIDNEIAKRRHKWSLTSLAWIDWDDISQIIRIHIFKKWEQYDVSKPLQPWLNTIITHQIKNLIRNNYSNYARPCLRCDAAEPSGGCRIYSEQCSTCPLYAEWEKRKKKAYDVKMAVSIENHANEIKEMPDEHYDTDTKAQEIHTKMKTLLKPLEYKVYKGLFIDHKTEAEVATDMGYTTTERNRHPGYKQIKNIKREIMKKVRRLISTGEVDI